LGLAPFAKSATLTTSNCNGPGSNTSFIRDFWSGAKWKYPVEVFGAPNATLTVAGVIYVADDNFTITGSPVLTPEPSTGILWLTGVGLLIVTMRKRIAQGLPQAS
jgi:hypothetical protein